MSMCGHLTKRDKERWADKNRQAVADSVAKVHAEKAEKQANSTPGSPGYRPGGSPGSPGSPPNHNKQSGTDWVEESPAARAAHRKKMQDAHSNRFKDAHWTHALPIIETAKGCDVYMETVAHRMYGSNKKFVMAPQQISVSRAPRDVDNHLFTGAVHKEAESEQEMIARKIENHQIEISDAKGREALKDEMDNVRRQRSSTWKDKAIPTSSDSEVPL